MQNPFGAAKPRESVLANRAGKKEEDILKEEVLKEKLQVWHLRSSVCARAESPTRSANKTIHLMPLHQLHQIHAATNIAPTTQLRLTPDQIEAKTALESAVEDVKQELAAESDDQKKDALAAELKEKETKLDTLMVEFEASTEHSMSCHACIACLM